MKEDKSLLYGKIPSLPIIYISQGVKVKIHTMSDVSILRQRGTDTSSLPSVTLSETRSVCSRTHLVAAAVPRGYPRVPVCYQTTGHLQRGFASGKRFRPGNMRGNKLEQAAHGPTLFRRVEVPCMTVAHRQKLFLLLLPQLFYIITHSPVKGLSSHWRTQSSLSKTSWQVRTFVLIVINHSYQC